MSWPRLEVVRVVTVFDANEIRGKECERLGKITERKGFEKSIPDINHIANLESASATRFDELRKTMNGNADVLSQWMNRHCQELDENREEMVRLSREVDDLKADKVMLEARINLMAERLCKCSEGSPRTRGIGSAAEPLELEDEELEYVTPPLTSSPAEEVPSLIQGPP